MRAALCRGSHLDLAGVIGVFDSAVRIPWAKPLLGRPAVESIAALPRQDRSNNDLHCGSLSSSIPMPLRLIHRALLIISRIPTKRVNCLTKLLIFIETSIVESLAGHGYGSIAISYA